MTVHEGLAKLVQRHPELQVTAAFIAELYDEVGSVPLDTFFEPVSAILLKEEGKERHELFEVWAQDLTSWTRHISASTQCRMRAIEEPIIENLVAGRTLAAMVLLRSHFETAAMATYCVERLTDVARQNNPNALNDLIPRTLFGTAMKKHRNKDSVADLLSMCEGDTIRICHAVESLDKFYFQEAAEGKLEIVYSLLCDFGHPNHRGILDFIHSVDRKDGWLISYKKEEPLNPEMQIRAVETLLVSMRGGYSAAEMLRCWQFTQRDNGTIHWHWPSLDDAARVWEHFLQRSSDGSADPVK